MTEPYYLSDLFTPPEEAIGHMKGTCIVCGRSTEQGNKIDYSPNFTLWNLLTAGDCICPPCYELTRNQQYRRSMWVVNKEGITFFKKKEMLSHLLNPPEPPFGMYLTKTWQKQGFFKLINKLNYSQENYTVALDMKLIHVKLSVAKEMSALAKTLRKKKFTKEELKTGEIHAHRYKDCDLSLLEQLKEYANQQLWRLIVYAIN